MSQMKVKITKRRFLLILSMIGFAIAGIGLLLYVGSCHQETARLPVPVNQTVDFYKRVTDYRTYDLLKTSCGADVLVKTMDNITEFDCWHNSTIRPNASCSCDFTVMSYPKFNVTVCR